MNNLLGMLKTQHFPYSMHLQYLQSKQASTCCALDKGPSWMLTLTVLCWSAVNISENWLTNTASNVASVVVNFTEDQWNSAASLADQVGSSISSVTGSAVSVGRQIAGQIDDTASSITSDGTPPPRVLLLWLDCITLRSSFCPALPVQAPNRGACKRILCTSLDKCCLAQGSRLLTSPDAHDCLRCDDEMPWRRRFPPQPGACCHSGQPCWASPASWLTV